MHRTTLLTLATALLLPLTPAYGLLKVGDKAPPLKVTHWVQGKPISIPDEAKGKVVLLEFWATWCVPCIQIIPETNELYQKYEDKGLIVIGVTDSGQGQRLSTVQEFVKSQGNRMQYRIAFDDTQKTVEDYIVGTGALGIPHSVVLDKEGKIAWVGHPADPAMKATINDLLLDRFDPNKVEQEAQINARIEPLINEFNMAAMAADWQKCISLSEAMLKIDPDNLDALRFIVIIYVEELQSPDKLRDWVKGYIKEHADNARALSMLSSLLLAVPGVSDRQPDLALDAARSAVKSASDDVVALQTLASVYFEIGAIDEAIKYQQKAVEAANMLEKDDIGALLEYYKRCRALHDGIEGT